MYKNIEKFRSRVLKQVANTASFNNSWAIWGKLLEERFGADPSETDIFEIGNYLSDVFKGNKIEGRGQSAVSAGGAAWECLITWYLNLIFYGTNVIATRQNKKFVPEVINNALTVTISNQQTNTESDIVVYNLEPNSLSEDPTIKDINDNVVNNIENVELSVVQCKTNWNDNAQIPMLWDLIYNSQNFRITTVSVGINGYNPVSFGKFSYSFVTVPTSRGPFKQTSLSVLRVKNLTGGNYWGKPTEAGICSNINEYFLRNFSSTFSGGVKTHIKDKIISSPDVITNYLKLKF